MYSLIFKLLSLKCDFYCRILHFCPEFVLIPTGNTTKNRQNNTKFVSRDSGNARNTFYRSKCTHTREFDVIPARGSSLLANKYYVIQARESKTRYLEKFKINIFTRRIHTKLSTRKRLNTKSILHI
jgi:hypothetical protein